MKVITQVVFFGNGNVGVSDIDGNQVPELQVSITELLNSKAKELGYKLDGAAVLLPNGKTGVLGLVSDTLQPIFPTSQTK